MSATRTRITGFRPPWWATVALLAGLAVTCTAGLWQLGRAGEKTEIFRSFDSGNSDQLLRDLVSNERAGELRFRSISVYGKYESERQVLLDSMMLRGKAGYHVLTPLRIGSQSVLVNRGWVPAEFDRDVLPSIDVGSEARQIKGRLDLLPRPGLRMAAPPGSVSWPRRLLYPTAEQIADELGFVVMNYQILLDPGAPDGFERDWRPDLLPPERHFGYAVQWFGLAAAMAVIYLVLNIERKEESQRHA